MAKPTKLGRRTSVRVALVKGQASELLWHGKIETTLARAKSVQAYAEKLITLAMNTYEDNIKVVKEVVNEKGAKVKKEVVQDGPTKLAARRKIMASLYDMQEERQQKESKANFRDRTKKIKHPIAEKMFNLYAPHFSKRAKELGQKGGYTRIVRKYVRKGDNAEMVEIAVLV